MFNSTRLLDCSLLFSINRQCSPGADPLIKDPVGRTARGRLSRKIKGSRAVAALLKQAELGHMAGEGFLKKCPFLPLNSDKGTFFSKLL